MKFRLTEITERELENGIHAIFGASHSLREITTLEVISNLELSTEFMINFTILRKDIRLSSVLDVDDAMMYVVQI